MTASALLCFPREESRGAPPFGVRASITCVTGGLRDPCSRRMSPSHFATGVPNRRRFLKLLAGGLALPVLSTGDVLAATGFISQNIDPAKLWDGDRQLVFAYKQGEELGELCRRLDAAKDRLPVSILWRLPPDWVTTFPTIHFEVSSRRWKKYEGWTDARHFVAYYEQFNPPPKSADAISPFKAYATAYEGPEWTYPGKIADHLLDPASMHRFSEYELRGLTKREMENLHAAHHEELIDPGRRPPQPPEPAIAGAS